MSRLKNVLLKLFEAVPKFGAVFFWLNLFLNSVI
jgi:hypothetical protein